MQEALSYIAMSMVPFKDLDIILQPTLLLQYIQSTKWDAYHLHCSTFLNVVLCPSEAYC